MNYKKNKRYFIGVNYVDALPPLTFGGLFIVLPLMLLYVFKDEFFLKYTDYCLVAIVVGAVLLAVGVLVLVLKHRLVVTDEMYDAEIKKYLADYRRRVPEKLGIADITAPAASPFVLSGYITDGANYIKSGSDGVLRSDIYELCVLLFTETELRAYSIRFKTTGIGRAEQSFTCLVKDISSVRSVSKLSDTKKGPTESESLILTVTGGSVLELPMCDSSRVRQISNTVFTLKNGKKPPEREGARAAE